MSGGYRVIIAGALAALLLVTFGFGWISGTLNDVKEQRYQTYRHAADKPTDVQPSLTGGTIAKAFEYRAPCDNPEGHEESDLCAQWKAANAAEDGALWTKLGFWVGVIGSVLLLWQINLTRKAVEETSEATEAMRSANVISENAQRAWVRLGAIPKLVRRTGLNGLYIRVDFTAENTGGSAATHFMLYHRIMFRPYGDTGDKIEQEMIYQIDQWKDKHSVKENANLLPNDKEVSGDWKTFKAEEIQWRDRVFIGEVAQPMLLAAVAYKTVFEPKVLQITWRSWYLATSGEDGQLNTYIPKPDHNQPLGPGDLCADGFHRSASHHQHDEGSDKPIWPQG